MNRYRCYGLIIDSELVLPEMKANLPDSVTADLTIRLSHLAEEGPGRGQVLEPGVWIDSDLLRLHVPDIARYEIREGREILLDPLPGSSPASLRLYLLGTALGAALMQRGLLVLHGNAIRIGDQCMVCLGDSGAGKSTLAAAFMRRGYTVMADDVVPVDDASRAVPGFPRIKLWQHAADMLNIDTRGLERVRPDMDKYSFPLITDATSVPRPIRWIYLLEFDDQPDLRLQSVKGVECFAPLLENTYRLPFLNSPPLLAEHLAACARLAGGARMKRVLRPGKTLTADDTADALIQDMNAHP